MLQNLKSALVRIRNEERKQVVGAGFVLDATKKMFVTCAHVVDAAMGDVKTKVNSKKSVSIDFPFVATNLLLDARIITLIPKQPDGSGDIAILEVVGELPDGVEAAKVAIADSSHSDFMVFGFPVSFEEDGRWVEGKLHDRLVNRQIQAIGISDLGYFVEQGFSGSPVFDKEQQAIIGMMTRIDTDTKLRVAFLTPIDVIADIYPSLSFKNIRAKAGYSKHVFISYSDLDADEIAERIYYDLQSRGFSVWIDKYNIREGISRNAEIDAGLRGAVAVVVVLSPGSVLSLAVESEWSDAVNRYVPVIPILASECAVPRVLSLLKWIDFRSHYQTGFDELVSRLERVEQDHLGYLDNLLTGYLEAQQSAHYPERFQHKIDRLQDVINNWSYKGKKYDQIESRRARINKAIKLEQKRIQVQAEKRRNSAGRRVVGQRILDVSTYFRDRDSQRKKLGEFLADPSTRLVSVIGRGGIGKTAIVSKVLRELEEGSWLYTDNEINVDGIVYLSTRTKGISLERIFLDCGEMLGGELEKTLISIWTNLQLGTDDKVQRLLEILGDGFYIILLDNLEDLLDGNQQIKDKELQTFIDVGLRMPHNVRLLITTREKLALPKDVMKFDKHIVMEDGLPEVDAINVLKDLDPNGICGIRSADDELLRRIVRKVHGVPRALEAVASILANDPFTTLNALVGQDNLFKRKEFVEELVRENYKRLDQPSRRVMEALAVFGRPVPLVAIDFLLEPFVSGISTREVVSRLIQTYSIKFDRGTKLLSLHPIDRDYIYSQIPS